MKKNLKYIIAAFMSAALIFSAASCKNDTDDDEDTDKTVVFKATQDEAEVVCSFNSDKTFVTHAKGTIDAVVDNDNSVNSIKLDMDMDLAAGTYTGDPSKDGTVVMTTTKEASFADNDLSTFFSAVILKSTITNKEAPLKDITPKSETITISGGTFTGVNDDGESVTYTRQ